MTEIPVNLITALPCEAKPIATRLRLGRVQPDRGFPVYRRGHVALVIAGPGKINAAAATGFLHTLVSVPGPAIWINLGVAGHAEHNLGKILCASSVKDAATGRIWYPGPTPAPPRAVEHLTTLDEPAVDYAFEGMVDMEASAFCAIASRYAERSMVQVIKVISDNRHNSARGLRARQVTEFVEGAMDELQALIGDLQRTAHSRSRSRTLHSQGQAVGKGL